MLKTYIFTVLILLLLSCGSDEAIDNPKSFSTVDGETINSNNFQPYSRYFADIVNLSSVGLAAFVELNFTYTSSGNYSFKLQDMLQKGYQESSGKFEIKDNKITLYPSESLPQGCFSTGGQETHTIYKTQASAYFNIPLGSEILKLQETAEAMPTLGSPRCL